MRVNPKHLYTLSEYGRKVGESPQMIKYWAMTEKLRTIDIQGATLIYHPEEKKKK